MHPFMYTICDYLLMQTSLECQVHSIASLPPPPPPPPSGMTLYSTSFIPTLTCHSHITPTLFTRHSHVTLGSVNPLYDGFNGHPAKREFPIRGLDVDVILSSQSKVRDLQHLVLPNQHIPAGKVSVDNAQLGEELLLIIEKRRWKRNIQLLV